MRRFFIWAGDAAVCGAQLQQSTERLPNCFEMLSDARRHQTIPHQHHQATYKSSRIVINRHPLIPNPISAIGRLFAAVFADSMPSHNTCTNLAAAKKNGSNKFE